MRVLDFPLLADENIHPQVVASLRTAGYDVISVMDEGLTAHDDTDVLRFAQRNNRVVVTHDRDFGALAVQRGEAFMGILYLRPGHLPPAAVLSLINSLRAAPSDVTPPFIAVVEQKEENIRMRLRMSAQAT